MSRHKNPLKDLDFFLKQQASSLATPTPLREHIASIPATERQNLVQQLIQLAETDREKFLDALIEAAAASGLPQNALLINTALYLKHPHNWKEAVKNYWKAKT